MDHFAGLDVSVKDMSVCIVDDTGKIVREVKVASEPEALLAVRNSRPDSGHRWNVRKVPDADPRTAALRQEKTPVPKRQSVHRFP